jgi:hypothetical protein
VGLTGGAPRTLPPDGMRNGKPGNARASARGAEGSGAKGFPPEDPGGRRPGLSRLSRGNNNEEGRRGGRPWFVFVVFLAAKRSGERGFAVRHQHVLVSSLYRERVVLFLEPDKLGFQVPYSLLEAAHLGNHAGIGTADVAE